KGGPAMEDLEQYLKEIIEPTVEEFEENPASRRHAFLACVATFHGVDYLAHRKQRAATLRQQWQRQSEAFRIVDHVVHAFKHVASGNRSNPELRANEVVSVKGAFSSGFSSGFQIASVRLLNDPSINVLRAVQDAVQFLREQLAREAAALTRI